MTKSEHRSFIFAVSRAMLFNRKRDSSVFRIKWNDTMLFISVRRLCLINGSITGIGNVLQCMQHNVFDAIGKPSVAFPVTSILQQCVHVPVKHSETDFIILPILLNIINVYSSFSCTVNCALSYEAFCILCIMCMYVLLYYTAWMSSNTDSNMNYSVINLHA